MIKKYRDKIEHFIVSAGLVIIGAYLKNIAFGVAIALVFGVLKEAWDATKPNNKWDWWDIGADLCGIILGVWLLW